MDLVLLHLPTDRLPFEIELSSRCSLHTALTGGQLVVPLTPPPGTAPVASLVGGGVSVAP